MATSKKAIAASAELPLLLLVENCSLQCLLGSPVRRYIKVNVVVAN
jgi:hypothetical protein